MEFIIDPVDAGEVMKGGRRSNLNSTNSFYYYLTFQHKTSHLHLLKCKLKQPYKHVFMVY